ncbi:MAG: pyridine nucleotide-disulfide oxidoreductase [Hydrogenophilales bacterium 12-61-10]|nr:MAG: pyridine nucleotide-disulfide oxidoreductase [Hydrogenophilales bacterium 12-61-10]OYX30366.1 MAG: pyridine nucleotide-disulfide oxidoreductase [Hydrogenophilales bacterium 32-62-9]
MSAHIVILGCGFAALTAVRELRRRDREVRITLVAPKAELMYYPSLIWVPSGLRRANDLNIDVSGFLAEQQVTFHAGRVTGLQDGGRTVLTDRGTLANDALLIASGGRFLKALPGIEHALTICEGAPAAEAIRERLANMDGGSIALGFGTNPKEQGAMRGGPMFELLFGIDTLLRRQGRRDKFRLVFFNAAKEPGKRLGDKAVAGLLREMQKRNIATHLGHKLTGFTADTITTEGGEVPADLILFMPGMSGPAWANEAGLPLSDGGFFKADTHCQVAGADKVFVAGDSGSYPGPDWLPKQAHIADLQARAAAENLLLALAGKPPVAHFKPELICIVDTLDRGILVYRDEKRALILPPCRLFHWAKRFFEWQYLRPYRKAQRT